MQAGLRYLTAAVIGYLAGAIPVGYIVGRVKGVDVRAYGSGRTGMSNVWRTLGIWPAVFTVLGDGFKAFLAVLLVRLAFGDPWMEAVTGLACLVGHNRSAFIGLEGGAGVICHLGVMMLIAPDAFLVIAITAILIIYFTRYTSLASLSASALTVIAMAILVYLGRQPLAHLAYCIAATALIFYLHRPNIRRLLDGTERKVGQRAERGEEG